MDPLPAPATGDGTSGGTAAFQNAWQGSQEARAVKANTPCAYVLRQDALSHERHNATLMKAVSLR
jgi:hypothetical protein